MWHATTQYCRQLRACAVAARQLVLHRLACGVMRDWRAWRDLRVSYKLVAEKLARHIALRRLLAWQVWYEQVVVGRHASRRS